MANSVSGLPTINTFIRRKLGNFLLQVHVGTEQEPLFPSVHATAEPWHLRKLGLFFVRCPVMHLTKPKTQPLGQVW